MLTFLFAARNGADTLRQLAAKRRLEARP